MARTRAQSAEERIAIVGSDDVLWDREMVSAYLKCSVRTVDALPIPRAYIGGPRWIPHVVRAWAERQLDHQLPPAA